jgi:hypothetical protein
MPLLYGEEEKAFQRLQEEIIKTTPDLSILAWAWPPPHRRHDSDNRNYCGVLAEKPSYFTWCRGTQLLIRRPMREFSVSNNRVTIDSTIKAVPTFPGSNRNDYVLPIHFDNSARDRSRPKLGVAFRKVGDGQFLRGDPHKLYDMESNIVPPAAVGTHQLLIKPPSAQSSSPFPTTPSNQITEEHLSRLRPRSIRIMLPSNIYVRSVLPQSRFDYKDGLFFVSDEADDQNDWGIVHVCMRSDHSKGNLSSPPIYFVIYTTSWGSPAAPQCSITPYLSYAQQLTDMQSRIGQWDHNTREVLHDLLAFNIPCARSAVADIPGTSLIAVVSLVVRTREDVPPRMPRDYAWDVHISYTVYESDSAPFTQGESQWDLSYYGGSVAENYALSI